MADEGKSRGGSDNRGRRRRYFKRKGGDKAQEGSATPAASSDGANKPASAGNVQASGAAQEGRARPNRERIAPAQPRKDGSGSGSNQAALEGGRSRGFRKRRRSKSRRSGEGRGAEGRAEVQSAAEKEQEYIPPKSVYIYTHVLRSGRDTYEFRADHFSGVGHSLEDYSIDISELFDKPKVSYGADFARFYAELEDGVQSSVTDPRFPPEVEAVPVSESPVSEATESGASGGGALPSSESPIIDTTSVQDYVPDDAGGDSISEAKGALDDLTEPHFEDESS